MLRLAHPAPGGQGADPPRRRHRPSPLLSLTHDEARAVRAFARNTARARYGTLKALADALGVYPGALTQKSRPSPGLAVALARLTGQSADLVLGRVGLVAAPPVRITEGGAA